MHIFFAVFAAIIAAVFVLGALANAGANAQQRRWAESRAFGPVPYSSTRADGRSFWRQHSRNGQLFMVDGKALPEAEWNAALSAARASDKAQRDYIGYWSDTRLSGGLRMVRMNAEETGDTAVALAAQRIEHGLLNGDVDPADAALVDAAGAAFYAAYPGTWKPCPYPPKPIAAPSAPVQQISRSRLGYA